MKTDGIGPEGKLVFSAKPETIAAVFERLQERKMLTLGNGSVRLTRQGLLRVDSLLPEFYDKKYRDSRYT